jgi:hypothetical protein
MDTYGRYGHGTLEFSQPKDRDREFSSAKDRDRTDVSYR